MFKKITVALIASTLFAAPIYAQSTMRSQNGAPATVGKITTAKPVFAKAQKTVKVKKHKVKKVKIGKHVKHVKHVSVAKHGKHFATTKPTMPAHHN